MRALDGELQTWANVVLLDVGMAAIEPSQRGPLVRSQSPDTSDAVAVSFLVGARAVCTQLTADEPEIPQRSPLGRDRVGPYGAVSSWLLGTESLALAMITGMIGFGLLGAAVSTFILARMEGRTRAGGLPSLAELADVVLRGVSAAIVVFLAVMGGLAVFGGENAEPNPYALLFACLVAAVFSENVWLWARKELRLKLPGGATESSTGSQDGN